MIDNAHLQQFSKTLSVLLREEQDCGNQLVETSKGWPEPRTIMVFLARPFQKEYKEWSLEYREVNDPHYWKAEYYDQVTGHVLACKFG